METKQNIRSRSPGARRRSSMSGKRVCKTDGVALKRPDLLRQPDASSLSESGFEAIPRHPNPRSLPHRSVVARSTKCMQPPSFRRRAASRVLSPYSVSLLPLQPFITRPARSATIFCLNSYCVRCRSVALCMHVAATEISKNCKDSFALWTFCE